MLTYTLTRVIHISTFKMVASNHTKDEILHKKLETSTASIIYSISQLIEKHQQTMLLKFPEILAALMT